MGRPSRISYLGAFYHITSRGNEQKAVFKRIRDREKFLEYLESATERYHAVIHAYCLMDNHYHLLLETPSGNLSKIMAHINGAYTNYFNTKRKRFGHLFQGRYKAILVEAGEYAKELSRYIHLNPVRAGLSELPEDYEWSSHAYYIGRKKAPDWLKMDFILGFFGKALSESQAEYKVFVGKLIGLEYESPLTAIIGSTVLGSMEFVGRITEKYISNRGEYKDLPAIKALKPKISMEDIENEVDHAIKDKDALSRSMKIYLCHRHTGEKLDEIGRHFGIGGSGVCQAARRIAEKIEKDQKLKNLFRKIDGNLSRMKV
jgi:putative transposase